MNEFSLQMTIPIKYICASKVRMIIELDKLKATGFCFKLVI